MSMFARAALLLLLTIGLVRLSAAESDELESLRAKAERGNALAQYNLGLAFAQGRQVAADPAEAFAWLSLASENGATGKALGSLLGNISDDQLVEGRRLLQTYRVAISTKSAAVAAHTPKLAPRGFVVEAAPPTPPPLETAAPAVKAPEAVSPPIATTPAGGGDAAELAQARRDLARVRQDLANANSELATLRSSIVRLEAAVAEAKATEARLLTELKAVRPEPIASQSAASANPADKTTQENPASPQP